MVVNYLHGVTEYISVQNVQKHIIPNMTKYKVTIIVDIEANNEEEAKTLTTQVPMFGEVKEVTIEEYAKR